VPRQRTIAQHWGPWRRWGAIRPHGGSFRVTWPGAGSGRARKAGDVADRARKAVTSRIRESIERIGTEHPALARHLENAIRTGTFCRYQPDRPLRWQV
jgi:hypothetical protein